MLPAYALAVAEENAAGHVVVSAPTCGSAGVVPAVLHYLSDRLPCPEQTMLHALATAGLIGNLIKHNASISGARVGCQGEIGAACAMASAAAVQLLGGTIRQIEYAAEMGLEHHLGLTCDRSAGWCRSRASSARFRRHPRGGFCQLRSVLRRLARVSFDEVVEVMEQTGHDLPSLYRETSAVGWPSFYRMPPTPGE
jgi:L-serine dehydratase